MKLGTLEQEFYGVKPELLSYDFIAGLVVGEGTFYWTKYGSIKRPVFALKMHIRDFDLMINIKYSLGLKERVYEYTHNDRHYAFLMARSFEDLRTVITVFHPRITGYKRFQFIEWLKQFSQGNESYQNLYNIFKEEITELGV